LNALNVDKLKEELKKRNIDFPKNAKKKDLQELLMNSNTNK
jgi:predicted HTH domain antitoxin